MNIKNFKDAKPTSTKKKITKIAVITPLTTAIADANKSGFTERMLNSIALQREYNATLRELIDLQTQLMALHSLKQRAAARHNPGLFRVPDAS